MTKPTKPTPSSGNVAFSRVSRLQWKPLTVFAVETQKDVWALVQIVDRVNVAFFDVFSQAAVFTHSQWEDAKVLFVNGVTRQFFRGSHVVKCDLTGKKDIQVPCRWINVAIQPSKMSKVVLWKSTPHERRLITYYGGSLIDTGNQLISRISLKQKRLVDETELLDLAIFPYTNWRLYLCYKLNRNVDPLKELYFRRDLPLEYSPLFRELFPTDDY